MLVVASWLYFDSNRDAHDRRVALVQNLVATFSRDFYAIGAMQDQEMAYEMASRLSAFPSLWHLEVVRADGESVFVYRNTPEDIQLHQLHPTDLARLDTDKPGQKSTRPLLASTRVVEHESALVAVSYTHLRAHET